MDAYRESCVKYEKICYIVGAGEDYGMNFSLRSGDFLIAADGGFSLLSKIGMKTDLVVGDFDSLGGEIPENARVLPAEKDVTDVFEAVRLGMERGFKIFVIYGGTGGRADHTFANIQILAHIAKRGMRGFLVDAESVFTVIENDEINFDEDFFGFVSVFSLTDFSEGVTERGLKYSLENAVLENTFPLGVSNEFTGERACVSVEKGQLLVVYPRR